MNKKVSLLKGIVNYSISTWVNFVLGIVSVIITTRLLSPDVYGLISIFFSFSSVLLYILTLGMDGAYIRFYNEPPGTDSKNQLLYKNILVSSLVCLIVGSVATFFFGNNISNKVFGIGGRLVTGLLFIYTFCNIILRYLNISFRMSFRVFQYNFQNILINCLSKVLVIVAAFFTDGFRWIVTILTIGLLTVLCVYFFTQRKEYIPYNREGRINASLSLDGYREYIKFALFSAPTYIVVYLNTYLNQQLIRSLLSAYALGVFSSTVMFGSILSAIKGGFSTFWSAYVYQNYNDDSKRIGMMHNYVIVFSIIMASILVCSRDIIYFFIGTDYHSSKTFFSLLLVLPVLNFISETTDKGIALAKKNHISLIVHLLSVIANVGLCFALIPSFGLMGAAVSNAVSAILLYVLNTYYGQKYYKTIIDYKKSICGTIILLLVVAIPSIVHNIWYIMFLVLSIDMLSLVLFHDEFKDLLHRVLTIFKV